MMRIDDDTKIAAILKQHPAALEAIISIHPKLEKLRNPILRKLIAGRATIKMAAAMNGVTVQAFYEKLQPLGFEASLTANTEPTQKKALPAFMKSLSADQIVELDVRPSIAAGTDPLSIITQKVKTIKAGQVLKLINVFEPVPLMRLLEKQGFLVYADEVNDNLVETYFYKQADAGEIVATAAEGATTGWNKIRENFLHKTRSIDVRAMEMPQPMMAILEALQSLPPDEALLVYHKRIPVFLLPELAEQKFDYRIKKVSDGDVQMLIFKP